MPQNRFRNTPPPANPEEELVLVCNERHIQRPKTELAIMVRVGQTLYGEPIYTWLPKSAIQTRPSPTGGRDIYIPRHMCKARQCVFNQLNTPDRAGRTYPGFTPFSEAF